METINAELMEFIAAELDQVEMRIEAWQRLPNEEMTRLFFECVVEYGDPLNDEEYRDAEGTLMRLIAAELEERLFPADYEDLINQVPFWIYMETLR